MRGRPSQIGTLKEKAETRDVLRLRRGKLVGAGALAAILVASIAWFSSGRGTESAQPMRVVPLTSYPGSKENPSFSPDGSQVAFCWNGESRDNYDIYVRFVDGGTPLRLTTHPAPDVAPAWSPDGRQIAFAREWGRYSIFLVSLASGEKRALTSPPDGGFGVYDPAISPDGQTLAFVRWNSGTEADLYVSPLAGGAPERLTADNTGILGVAWTQGSREIVFSSGRSGSHTLWWIPASPSPRTQPKMLVGTGEGAFNPAISHHSTAVRLGYQRTSRDINIWGVSTERNASPPRPLIASTRGTEAPKSPPTATRSFLCPIVQGIPRSGCATGRAQTPCS